MRAGQPEVDNMSLIPYKIHGLKRYCWGILLLASLLTARPTDIQFDLSAFLANPTTNRTVTAAPLSPFLGNTIFLTSDSNGQCWLSNAVATTYNCSVKAPPAAINFQLYIPATNLGNILAINYTAISQIATYPAGLTAWSVTASDSRYARGSNSFVKGNLTGQPVGSVFITNGLGAVWGTGTVINVTNLPEASVLNLVPDLNNRILKTNGQAYSGANLSADFQVQNLYSGSAGVLSVDWNGRNLEDGNATTSEDWLNRILYDYSSGLSLNWSNRTLYGSWIVTNITTPANTALLFTSNALQVQIDAQDDYTFGVSNLIITTSNALATSLSTASNVLQVNFTATNTYTSNLLQASFTSAINALVIPTTNTLASTNYVNSISNQLAAQITSGGSGIVSNGGSGTGNTFSNTVLANPSIKTEGLVAGTFLTNGAGGSYLFGNNNTVSGSSTRSYLFGNGNIDSGGNTVFTFGEQNFPGGGADGFIEGYANGTASGSLPVGFGIMGFSNSISGSTAPRGQMALGASNSVSADGSTAMGVRAQANHVNSYVWGDGAGYQGSTAANQFRMYASAGSFASSFLAIGSKTNLYLGSDLVGSFGAGSAAANGTFFQLSSTLWTNYFSLGYLTNNSGSFVIRNSSGSSLYSASSLTGTYIDGSGTMPVPMVYLGSHMADGLIIDGAPLYTNMTASIALSVNNASNNLYLTLSNQVQQATNVESVSGVFFFNADNPNNVVTALRPAMAYNLHKALWQKTNATLDSVGWSCSTTNSP